MPAFILMGVSGAGKSTIGSRIAADLGIPFIEGDDFHPPANIQKMASGIPLQDSDRVAWIDALMREVNLRAQPNVLVACSALTRFVRAKIRAQSRRPVVFLHLTAPEMLIEERLHRRGQHFMKPGMLRTQLAALEPSVHAIPIDTSKPLPEVCAAVHAEVAARSA
jgi:gluconokinase